MLQHLADEGAGPRRRIEDLDALVDQRAAEMLAAEPVRPLDHEAHDLVGRIDHAEPVGGLGIVDLVEILVDRLEEGLLLVVPGDLRRIGADGGVIRLQRAQGVALHRAGEELALEIVERFRDVVLAVEIALIEDMAENLFGEDMLDQHFLDIGLRHAGIDGLARLLQERRRSRGKGRVGRIGRVDLLAQGVEHGGEIALELRHGSAELRDLGPLPGEEALQQGGQRIDIAHGAAHYLLPVLDQHRRLGILEDDVGLRIAVPELACDLGIEIVTGILGLPEPVRDAQFVQDAAIGIDLALHPGLVFELGNEDQVLRPGIALEQVLESLADDLLGIRPGEPPQPVELGEIGLDQHLAHGRANSFGQKNQMIVGLISESRNTLSRSANRFQPRQRWKSWPIPCMQARGGRAVAIEPSDEEPMLNSLDIAKEPSQTRVVVAMSGGVDSSVVAAMMQREGYDVIGITLQLYDHGAAVHRKGACCAGQDIHDARRVAEMLGIPHYVLDYESRFREAVIDNFADSYLAGETPIPCVECNRSIKFKDLLATAQELGADVLATGHYVASRALPDGRRALYRALDPSRDQSYFLYATTPEQLAMLRFPLAEQEKSETRALARELGLVVAEKGRQPGYLLRAQRQLRRCHRQAEAACG